MSARGALHGGPNIHSASVPCPVEGCGLVLPSRGHLGQHRRRVHDAPSKADREILSRAPAGAASRAGISAGAASVAIAVGRAPEPDPGVVAPAEILPAGDERRGPLLARFMARTNPNVEPVSAAIVALPWVSFPRDRPSCEAIARSIDLVIAGDDAATSDGERKFWKSLGEHIVAIAGQVATP